MLLNVKSPFSTKRRPSPSGPRTSGGPLRSHDVVTLSSPTKKGHPPGLPSKTIITANDAEHLHVVSQVSLNTLLGQADIVDHLRKLTRCKPDWTLHPAS
jgi:hypothetical protein